MNKGDKFYQLFNCWLSNSKTRNNNIELSLIILGMRVQSKMLFISAANFQVFLAVRFFLCIINKRMNFVHWVD